MIRSVSRTFGLCSELVRVLQLLPAVESWRRRSSLHRAVELARLNGVRRAEREPGARKRLRRAIGAADRRLPGGGNCVRRALLEMALDRGAAREALCAGLRAGGGPGSGHAWLESQPPAERFAAVIRI